VAQLVAEEKKYGIGEVQELLRSEFPDITISKIRFLEKEGLVSPERTQSGYRKYSRSNIKQLSYILRLQREEYLPLSVIKRKIQDLKSGKVVAGDLTVMSGQYPEAALSDGVSVSIDLAPAKLGLSQETLKELIDYNIVTVREGHEGKYFAPSEIRLLGLAKEFFRFGVEPRHLRMYRQFVGREAAFIEQIIRPQLQHRDPTARRSAIKDLEGLMGVSRMFLQALLADELSEYLPRPSAIELDDESEPPAAKAAPEPGEDRKNVILEESNTAQRTVADPEPGLFSR